MKSNSLGTLIVSLSLAGSAFGLNIGDKAPDTTVKMKNVDGKEVTIADVAGKSIPAAMLMATFQASLKTLSATPGTLVELVGRIAHSTRQAPLEILERNYPIDLQRQLAAEDHVLQRGKLSGARIDAPS